MIILEFRFPENFLAATRILDTQNISYWSEVSTVEWRPSRIYFFTNKIFTDCQHEAIRNSLILEEDDRNQQKIYPVLNLAVPM